MADFVHLHVHSDFSLLDGLGKVKALTHAAAEMGMPALALTDHGVMFGVLHFYHAAKKAGVKPIVGCEVYISPRRMTQKDHKRDAKPTHLILLAENETGYHNLMQIATAAQLEGFYYKPRVDKEFLAAHAEGLIALSACGSGEVPRLLQNRQPQRARQAAEWYRDVFGPDHFFLELQEHDLPEMGPVNRALVEMSRETGIPLVATNDAHYIRRQQAHAHEVLLCIQTGKTMTEPNRMRMNNDSYYLRSPAEMAALFAEAPEALRNTLRIAERCDVNLDPTGFHLPELEVPPGHTAATYLRRLTETGLRRLYGDAFHSERVQQRLDYELAIIHQMGFDVYFLIVWDLCQFSKERDIWWNVRGSAAGSIVAYGLGITNLDPLAHDLIFERFLNPGRVSMPDIDLDYPDDRRQEMIDYTVRKYGVDKVAQIITFGTLGAKAAIRDVGRALDIPLGEVDKVARLVPAGPGVKLDAALAHAPELRQMYEGIDYVRTLIDTAREVEGVSRHASTHAAGVVVTDKPLVEYTPLHRPTKGSEDGLPVTQYTMDVLEDTGLLKVDFLGLSTLTILRLAVDLIQKRHGVAFTPQNIPLDDPKTYRLLSSGEVTGVFQVESGGFRRVLTAMQPTRFEHIVAALALYRPGPMEFIDDYIAGLHGSKEPEYIHPALEPILGETYGICVSGDAIVFNARTGKPHRMDELGQIQDLWVQGVNEQGQPAIGRVTHFIVSGRKEVWQATLRNGAQIKVTPDHRLLTERGWKPLSDLQTGDYIATLPGLVTQGERLDRRKLRVLAYLIAGGDISNLASVHFVSKDPLLIQEYKRCLRAFENLRWLRQLNWQEIVEIEPAGVEDVYDITVEGLHNFVANNIIVHNCVYQEQIIRILTDIAGYSPGDADLVRKAVGKKKRAELVRHRASFVKGAREHSGLDETAANTIFDAFEYFARYGFNKAHSSNYAVITVQTAYLKAHYPVEYMTALLTVEQHNTDKVGLFIAEARRLGIEVLPPNVNRSGMDFTIEDGADGARPAIRYGLGAIKNVGEGPVEAILAAREAGGPFKDIDDFCQRVDLRQVNRRALECLIKAGALSPFGGRAQLLAVMDRMISISQQAHGAAQQYSMFDLPAFAAAARLAADLPHVDDVSRKEVLGWEKELVGAYISDHPLSRVWTDLEDAITALTGEIDETMAGRNVTMAGLVTSVRHHTTKKGDPMAFAQIEDLQGTIDLVVFPSVWEQTRELWEPERILVVRGKVNFRGREPSILVDSATNEIAAPRPPAEPAPPKRLRAAPQPAGPVHLRVTIPRGDDMEGVIRRLGQVYDLLRRYPGQDRFSLYVENGSQGRIQISFPNDTTGHCLEMEQKLREMLGAGTVRVEPLENEQVGEMSK